MRTAALAAASVNATYVRLHKVGVGSVLGLCWGVQDFYGTTLDALVEAKNERLWFKTQLKLCSLWFKLREYSRAARILRELHKCVACQNVTHAVPCQTHLAPLKQALGCLHT